MSTTDQGPDRPRPGGLRPTGIQAEKIRGTTTGVLAWFARNAVAANIIMIVLIVGGLFKLGSVKQEVFPEVDLDLILVNVAYPGASPEEVDRGVIQPVEEAIRGLDGVKEVRSTANEGVGVTMIELMLGEDADQALADAKAAVDRITTFPENVERPLVFTARNRFQVISLVLYGDISEKALKALAEEAREDLLADPRITTVELSGVRPPEISIEIPQHQLREYGLTLQEVSQIVRQASIDLPAGGIKTDSGELLLRTSQRRDRGAEFEDIIVVSQPNGTQVRLGEIAKVQDGFADTDLEALFNGKRAIMVNVFRVGEQTPLDVAEAVHEYVAAKQGNLPPGVEMATWFDTSEFYADRIDLLIKNALIGLVLVLIILGIFLEIRLAFWVTLGIPISFIGSMWFLPPADVSVNMISLFAFIVVLGMVVDDAIIVGEAIYKRRQEGMDRVSAAIHGVKEVAAPVTFAIATTLIAFAPMLFVPGPAGKFFRNIPIVVMAVLFLSLVESLLILPAHLAHSRPPSHRGFFGRVHAAQERFSHWLERFIHGIYVPVAEFCARRRYLTLSTAFALLIVSFGTIAGGRLSCTFLPRVDGDQIFVEAHLPYGSSVETTQAIQQRILDAANETLAESGGHGITRGIFAQVGAAGSASAGDPSAQFSSSGSHLAEVAVSLVPSDERSVTSGEFARRWREKLEGKLPGVERLVFAFSTGPTAGKPIQVELSHPDRATLERAAEALATRLRDFDGVYDIDDGFERGKEQLDIELTEEARSLGMTEAMLAQQVRSSFFGAEAARQQRGRDELRVYVRLPKDERTSEYNIEELVVLTPTGGEIPFHQAAEAERGRAFTSIQRIDGRRAVPVTAEVDEGVGNAGKIMARVTGEVLPELKELYPALSYEIGGEAKEMEEVNQSLFTGFVLAVGAMFALLAIAFRSYVQPIIILSAIPFGTVGAIWGHLLMGFDFSMMSSMGVVALAGIVVNDSLVLVTAINRYREDGMSLHDAVVHGGARRFRPIILTSLTTFFGLAPMILETSVQARFLIPMAISLGFGVMFATVITLLLVPAIYFIIEDIKWALARATGRPYVTPGPATPAEPEAAEPAR